jgi:hypothetical protein
MEVTGILSWMNKSSGSHQNMMKDLKMANTPVVDKTKHAQKAQKHDKKHKRDIKKKGRDLSESDEESSGDSSSEGDSGSASDEEQNSSSSENEHPDGASRRGKKQHHHHISAGQVHSQELAGGDQWSQHLSVPLQQNVHTAAASGYYSQTQPLGLEQRNNETLNLPTEGQLKTIFEKLREFKIDKIFPDHLVNPHKRTTPTKIYSSSSSPAKTTAAAADNDVSDEEDSNLKNDPINTQLEKNIRMLFDKDDRQKDYDLDAIEITLERCVQYNNLQTQGKPNVAILNEHLKQDFHGLTDNMKNFYKHLLNAMKALIVYSSQNANMVSLELKIFERHAYQAWQEVLSYLKAIQIVILFAIKKKYLDSKVFRDLDIHAMINSREKELTRISEEMAIRKSAILQAEGMIQERDNMIRKIEERYNDAVKTKADLESSLLTLQSQKRLLDNPAEIAKYNIQMMSPPEGQ